MSEAASINVHAFQPYNGGQGKTAPSTDSSGATAWKIPGLGGGNDDSDRKRVMVTNDGDVTAYFRMGPAGVAADTDSLKILPDCAYLLRPPDTNPSGVWFATCTKAGETTEINVVFGYGT